MEALSHYVDNSQQDPDYLTRDYRRAMESCREQFAHLFTGENEASVDRFWMHVAQTAQLEHDSYNSDIAVTALENWRDREVRGYFDEFIAMHS